MQTKMQIMSDLVAPLRLKRLVSHRLNKEELDQANVNRAPLIQKAPRRKDELTNRATTGGHRGVLRQIFQIISMSSCRT